MRIIKPITITDSVVVSNNITPSTLPEWSSGNPYTQGDTVKIESVHSEYECLINNTNQNPSTNPLDPSGNPYWLRTGSTNDWRLFDTKTRSPSVNPSNITLTLQSSSSITGVALINIKASTLNITVEAGGQIKYTKDVQLRELVYTYTDWFFSPIESITTVVKLDLPLYTNAEITITADSSAGDVEIGELVLGSVQTIGCAQYGSSVGINDYSTKEVDDFGNFIIVERGFADRIEYDVEIESTDTNKVKKLLAQYRAKPLVYVGHPDRPELTTYGYYRRFQEVLRDFSTTTMTLVVEEII